MSTAYSNRPSPTQIQWALRNLPPMQLNQAVAANYLGRAVAWKTRFFMATETSPGLGWQLAFHQRGLRWHSEVSPQIYAQVNVERHLEFNTIRRGRRVNLYGTIVEVDMVLGITLRLDRFEILPVNLLDHFVIWQDRR
jgi:hypothetical protein